MDKRNNEMGMLKGQTKAMSGRMNRLEEKVDTVQSTIVDKFASLTECINKKHLGHETRVSKIESAQSTFFWIFGIVMAGGFTIVGILLNSLFER